MKTGPQCLNPALAPLCFSPCACASKYPQEFSCEPLGVMFVMVLESHFTCKNDNNISKRRAWLLRFTSTGRWFYGLKLVIFCCINFV